MSDRTKSGRSPERMAFGATPHRDRSPGRQRSESVVYRILGWPHLLRRLQWPHVASLLAPDRAGTVVDLGAGSMQYSVEIARRFDRPVIAVDLAVAPGCASWAESRNIRVVKADALALPFEDASVDRIVVSSLLQAVPDAGRLLSECRRVLKAHGSVVLIVPNHYRYLPRVYARLGAGARQLLGLPITWDRFVCALNRWFHVHGPQGYYSYTELKALLSRHGFELDRHRFSPGPLGALLWEIGVLLYPRWGPTGVRLAFVFYPIAKAWDRLRTARNGAEHVVRAIPAGTRGRC